MKLIADPHKIFNLAAEIHCGKFIIDSENKVIIDEMIDYFTTNPAYEKIQNKRAYSLRRGLMFFGNPGSGKTTIFEIFQKLICNTALRFKIYTSTDIVNNYNEYGQRFIGDLTGNLLIDELGLEPLSKWGSRDVMADLIFHRYRLWQQNEIKTHFISMLSPEDLQQKYGLYVFSRLSQMCNFHGLGDKKSYTDRRNNNLPPSRKEVKYPRFYITPEEEENIRENQKALKAYENCKGPSPAGRKTTPREIINKYRPDHGKAL